MIEVPLDVEDVNSKLVDIVVFADVDFEENVDCRLVRAESLETGSQSGNSLTTAFNVYLQFAIVFVKDFD